MAIGKLHRKTNKECEQAAINKLALKYLKVIKKTINHEPLIAFIDKSTEALKDGNSNATYEELDALSRINDDDRISVKEIFRLVNCTTFYFMNELKDKLRKFKDKGDYSKVDVELEIEKNRLSRKNRSSFSKKII